MLQFTNIYTRSVGLALHASFTFVPRLSRNPCAHWLSYTHIQVLSFSHGIRVSTRCVHRDRANTFTYTFLLSLSFLFLSRSHIALLRSTEGESGWMNIYVLPRCLSTFAGVCQPEKYYESSRNKVPISYVIR